MAGLLDWLQREGVVVRRAPATFLIGGALIAGATWTAASIFFEQEIKGGKQEISGARQEASAARQERDLYKERLSFVTTALPVTSASGQASGAPVRTVSSFKAGEAGPALVTSGTVVPVPPGATGTDIVQSINQSGGITAHTVNLGPQQRVLGDADKQFILTNIPKDKPAMVTAVLGDAEALTLAGDIYAYLLANGFMLAGGGVAQGMFDGPVRGVRVVSGTAQTSILVGRNAPG